MTRSTPLYAPDGMANGVRYADRFDDGLVHNHHWAVTADEAYPCHSQENEAARGRAFTEAKAPPVQHRGSAAYHQDRHDDGLVHNHQWPMTGR